MSCVITPVSAFQSTNLNNKIDSFGRLADRIVRSIGAPLVSIEAHQDQIFENISIACEMFSKYAGYTREYLILDSSLYEKGRGIRLDYLYTLANPTTPLAEKVKHRTESVDTAPYLVIPDSVYINSCEISKVVFSNHNELSASFNEGLTKNVILDKNTYKLILSSIQLPDFFSVDITSYITLTGYRTSVQDIPVSFSDCPPLSNIFSNGIPYNTKVHPTIFSQITSCHPNFYLNNYFFSSFTDSKKFYDVLNHVPSGFYVDIGTSDFSNQTRITSSIYQTITSSALTNIGANGISISYFCTSATEIKYSVSPELSSFVLAPYSPIITRFPNGIQDKQIITKTDVDLITGTIGSGFDVKTFFDVSSIPHICMSPIPDKVFLDNIVLSAVFPSGFHVSDTITQIDFDTLSSNILNVPFSYYFTPSSFINYTVDSALSSNVFSMYKNLSGLYPNGLSAGRILTQPDFNFIQSESNFNLDWSGFFREVGVPYFYRKNINPLSSVVFLNSNVLSGVYPNGISIDTIIDDNTIWSTLTSNFDDSASNFLAYTPETTTHYVSTYTTIDNIPCKVFEGTPISSVYPNGISVGTALNSVNYNLLNAIIVNPLKSCFCESQVQKVSNACPQSCNSSQSIIYNNMFDYDIMDYRKVAAVTNFEEGATTGVNTLFTIEQTLAQQTYFSYAMGNYGFDLISWYTVKNWLETREKVLATKRSFEFNDRTQYLRIYPEPTDSVRFYGVLDCYIEKPIRDLIKEQWVYQYALALTKIGVGYVRGKFTGVNIFGGQAWAADIKNDGLTEKKELETQLFTNAAGFGDADPAIFLIG